MPSLRIVVLKNIFQCLFFCLAIWLVKGFRYPLCFQTSKKSLGRCVVPAVSSMTHALLYFVFLQRLPILLAGVMAALGFRKPFVMPYTLSRCLDYWNRSCRQFYARTNPSLRPGAATPCQPGSRWHHRTKPNF